MLWANRARPNHITFANETGCKQMNCYWFRFASARQLRSALRGMVYEVTSRYSPADVKVIWYDFGVDYSQCLCDKAGIPIPHVLNLFREKRDVKESLSQIIHLEKYMSSMLKKHADEDILLGSGCNSYFELIQRDRKETLSVIRDTTRYFPKVLVVLNCLGDVIKEEDVQMVTGVLNKATSAGLQIVVTSGTKSAYMDSHIKHDWSVFESHEDGTDSITMANVFEDVISISKVSNTDLFSRIDEAVLTAHNASLPRHRLKEDVSYKILYDV